MECIDRRRDVIGVVGASEERGSAPGSGGAVQLAGGRSTPGGGALPPPNPRPSFIPGFSVTGAGRKEVKGRIQSVSCRHIVDSALLHFYVQNCEY